VGEAHLATAGKGRAYADHCIDGVIGLLRQVRDMPLAGIAPTAPQGYDRLA
jgi:creatinine amidohydrolase